MHGRVRKKRIAAAGLLTLALVCAVVFAVVWRSCAQTQQEPSYDLWVAGIPVTQQILPEGYAGRPGIKRKVRQIVIHETANTSRGANAKSHARYLLEYAKHTEISWHYTVDDHEIYQHLPEDEVGWHAGDNLTKGGGNQAGIGVEICINEDGDYEKALINAEKLTAHLLFKYDMTIDDVKQHADFMQKNCPTLLRDSGRWEEFLQKTAEYLKTEQNASSETQK